MKEKVLVIEDDPTLLRVLTDNLKYEGYEAIGVSDGERGLESALNESPDLVLLDIMLPKVNGYEVCRLLREEGREMPIIMLTAKGEETDVVLGLNIGADDYVTKPFSIKELMARCRALLRRTRQNDAEVLTFGNHQLDTTSRKLLRDGQEVPLTPKEYEVLNLLLTKAGRALTRDYILSSVWGYDVFVTRRSVDRCISTLREKIEPDPHNPDYIKTVREVGYRFEMGE